MTKKILLILFCILSLNAYAEILSDLPDAPQFTMRSVKFNDTSKVSLSKYKDQIVILLFFQRWAMSSLNQATTVNDFVNSYEKEKEDDPSVVAIAVNTAFDSDLELQRNFIFQLGIDFSVVTYDESTANIIQQYGGFSVPTTYIITPEQKIYKKFSSQVNGEVLKDSVDKLIEEINKEKEEGSTSNGQNSGDKEAPETSDKNLKLDTSNLYKEQPLETDSPQTMESYEQHIREQNQQNNQIDDVTESQTGQIREEQYDSNPAQALY